MKSVNNKATTAKKHNRAKKEKIELYQFRQCVRPNWNRSCWAWIGPAHHTEPMRQRIWPWKCQVFSHFFWLGNNWWSWKPNPSWRRPRSHRVWRHGSTLIWREKNCVQCEWEKIRRLNGSKHTFNQFILKLSASLPPMNDHSSRHCWIKIRCAYRADIFMVQLLWLVRVPQGEQLEEETGLKRFFVFYFKRLEVAESNNVKACEYSNKRKTLFSYFWKLSILNYYFDQKWEERLTTWGKKHQKSKWTHCLLLSLNEKHTGTELLD